MSKRNYLNIRDNFGRFQKYATVNITKRLQEIADVTGKNLRDDIAKELKEKYKANVLASYEPRGDETGYTYEHTDKFYDNIEVAIQEDKVQIVIQESDYPNGKTTLDVYNFLTYGTTPDNGKNQEYRFQGDHGLWKTAKNYPTPIHPFEDQTKVQMIAYLESIKPDIKNHKYSKRR